jgi:hypothetical protein
MSNPTNFDQIFRKSINLNVQTMKKNYDESTDINLVFSMVIFLCINLIKLRRHFGIEGVVTSWEREYVSLVLYY